MYRGNYTRKQIERHTRKHGGIFIMKRRFFGMMSAAVMALASIPAAPVSAASVGQKLSVQSGGNPQERGNCDGYSYEVWIDNTGGSGSMTLGSGGTFSTEWSATMSRGNFLARRGRSYDADRKKATSYETTVLNYAADYTASSQGNSRLCVYGWFRDPLTEYYIIEDFKNWCPSQDANKQDSKMVTIDGAQYEIFWLWHEGPDITGRSSRFKQYFSVRQNRRTSGSITVTDHFKAWEKAGWGIGTLYEIALNVEGWESSGSANVTKLTLSNTPNPDPDPDPNPEPEIKYTAPSGSGTGATDAFEGTGTDWTARGESVKYGFTSDFKHSGSKSLYVTGRTDSWNGVQLKSDELKAGDQYDVSAFVGFNSPNYNSNSYTLGLQYTLNGKENYDNLVDSDCSSGKWTELATTFTVPSGATDISLYVQSAYNEGTATAQDKLDFFLDDVKLTNLSQPEIETTTTTTTTTTETTKQSLTVTLKGDVDENGAVDVLDAVMLARVAAEDTGTGISDQGKVNGELDGKDGITSNDLRVLLMALANIKPL